MIASTRLRRAMRSSSSFFSRSSISLRNLKISIVAAMITDIEIFLITFSKMQTLFSVIGQDTEVFITVTRRGIPLVTQQSLKTVTFNSDGMAKTQPASSAPPIGYHLNVVSRFLCFDNMNSHPSEGASSWLCLPSSTG
jgi:hypothetical protein